MRVPQRVARSIRDTPARNADLIRHQPGESDLPVRLTLRYLARSYHLSSKETPHLPRLRPNLGTTRRHLHHLEHACPPSWITLVVAHKLEDRLNGACNDNTYADIHGTMP